MTTETESMNLNGWEATCLARRIVAQLVAEHEESWLMWEDFPNLGEHAFERFQTEVNRVALRLCKSADTFDRLTDIDSRLLIERATA